MYYLEILPGNIVGTMQKSTKGPFKKGMVAVPDLEAIGWDDAERATYGYIWDPAAKKVIRASNTPIIAAPARRVTDYEFAELFTTAEFAVISGLRETNDQIRQMWYVAERKGTVNLDSPKMDALMSILKAAPLNLSDTREAQVRAGEKPTQ